MKSIIFPLEGYTMGGSHRSTISLAKNLKVNHGYKCLVVINKSNVNLKKHLIDSGINFFTVPVRDSFIKMIIHVIISTYYLLKNKVEIIHINDGKNGHWSRYAKLFKVKNIRHVRRVDDNLQNLENIPTSILFADHLIVISKFVKSGIHKHLYNKMTLVYNGVNQPPEYNKEIQKYNYRNGKINSVRFINASNNIDWKNIKYTIEVFESFKVRYDSKATLTVAGYGHNENELIEYFSEENKSFIKDVNILGFVNDIYPLIKNSDILISTSLKEGFGRTIVEGMLLKVLVVATNIGGHKETIDDLENGVLIETNDRNKSSDKIHTVLENEEVYCRITNNGHKHAKNKFSIEQYVDNIHQVYKKI